MTDDEEDLEVAALLNRHEGARTPMTDAEYEVWFTETKAKIAASIADPRPPLTAEEVDARLDRLMEELYASEEDAAA